MPPDGPGGLDGELLESILCGLDLGVLVVDRDLRVLVWNHFMEVHSGLSAEAILGQDLCEVVPELPRAWLERKVQGVLLLKNSAFTTWRQRPFLFRFKTHRAVTGGPEWMSQECTFTPVLDAEGQARAVCITVVDATEAHAYALLLERSREILRDRSQRDGLTGLANRRYFNQALKAEVDRARGEETALSLILFDLDHFKSINDHHGHLAGDEVLRSVSAIARDVVRSSDLVARFGGEEFVILLPGCPLHAAAALAERLRARIAAAPVAAGDTQIPVTASFGVAPLHPLDSGGEALCQAADEALYASKGAGRNCVTSAPPPEGSEDMTAA